MSAAPAMTDHDDDRVDAYSFDLPSDRIAQRPPDARDAGRMLVVAGDGWSDGAFVDLPSHLKAGDLLVVNDARVLPARLTARKVTGGAVRILLVDPLTDGDWSAMVKPSARLRPGTAVTLERRSDGEPGPRIVIDEPLSGGLRRVTGIPEDAVERFGEMPLPPYIDRSDGPLDLDRERYQTVYAERQGAVAAPTAGLHFTPDVLARLDAKGVQVARTTLQVGLGTFLPVRGERLSEVELHAERWSVPPETAEAIAACEARGGRLLAVGTTSCRTLESWHRCGRPTDGAWRSTRLFLHPGDRPTLAMSLLTNLHLPGSSLVMLVAAFVGRRRILDLYARAADLGYRFYSYGDAMLLL